MLLPMREGLTRTWAADPECAALADRHYSRRAIGAALFTPNGPKLVLRDNAGLVVFAWLNQRIRRDGEYGYNCTIFRNESAARSSDLIREAERWALDEWGPGRAYTFIDPRKVAPTLVRSHPVWGFCFYKAGWRFVRLAGAGKHLLEKHLEEEGSR